MQTQQPIPYFMTICVTILVIFISLLTFKSWHESQTIMIPEHPVVVLRNTEMNRSLAQAVAIGLVKEAVMTQCQWNEQKLLNGYYDEYAKMSVVVTKEKVEAQAEVQKSVCPEKK